MFFFLIACGTVSSPTPKQQAASSPVDTLSLTTQLSARDTTLSCTDLAGENLKQELVNIVETIQRPPWVPMRAATCLAELYPSESKPELMRWIADPQKKGLAFLIAGQLSHLSTEDARSVANAGLNGPHGQQIRIRLEKQNDERLSPVLSTP